MARRGWWEDYRCGCVSEIVPQRRDLSGYCPDHGESRRNVWRDNGDPDGPSFRPRPVDEERSPTRTRTPDRRVSEQEGREVGEVELADRLERESWEVHADLTTPSRAVPRALYRDILARLRARTSPPEGREALVALVKVMTHLVALRGVWHDGPPPGIEPTCWDALCADMDAADKVIALASPPEGTTEPETPPASGTSDIADAAYDLIAECKDACILPFGNVGRAVNRLTAALEANPDA